MVHLIHYDKKLDVLHLWPYVFRSDALETLKVLPGDLKYVVRNEQELLTADLPPLVLKEIYFLATGKELRWKSKSKSTKKVYTAMSKLTREEASKARKSAPVVAPTAAQVAGVVAAENETAEQKAERERVEAELKAAADQKKKDKEEAAAKKKAEKEENARLRKADAEARKKAREDAKAARAAAKSNGPVDCPHDATIKVLKPREEWPKFSGNRALIAAVLEDGQTVGQFVKLAAKAAPGGGVGDVRIYLDKGMIELVKAEPKVAEQVVEAPTPTETVSAE